MHMNTPTMESLESGMSWNLSKTHEVLYSACLVVFHTSQLQIPKLGAGCASSACLLASSSSSLSIHDSPTCTICSCSISPPPPTTLCLSVLLGSISLNPLRSCFCETLITHHFRSASYVGLGRPSNFGLIFHPKQEPDLILLQYIFGNERICALCNLLHFFADSACLVRLAVWRLE